MMRVKSPGKILCRRTALIFETRAQGLHTVSSRVNARKQPGGRSKGAFPVYVKCTKRILDVFFSLGGLVILSPVFLLIALWIKLDSKGPVLFRQKRIGKGKKLFSILKFRTMRTDAPHDMPTHMLGNPDAFITQSGRFLRKTSLDELPQIWNILVGDMSIVGPRPALWNQDDLVAERDKYGANDVLPGLTGWAQVNGRDELEIVAKAARDGEYVRDITFSMDAICIFKTVTNVLKHEGVVEGGTAGANKREIGSK